MVDPVEAPEEALAEAALAVLAAAPEEASAEAAASAAPVVVPEAVLAAEPVADADKQPFDLLNK